MARRLDVSRPSSSGSTPIQMVGTPAASGDPLGLDERRQALRATGRGPGMTRSAPQATAAWARPQALAWNMGTTGSTRSSSVGPSPPDGQHAVGVQERRAVRVDDALGVARGAARVAHRRGLVLVADVEGDRRRRGQQLLVVVHLLAGRRLGHLAGAVVHHHDVAHGLELLEQRPHQLGQRLVDEDDLVLGVVGHVDDLLGEQADVERRAAPGWCTARRSTARGGGPCSTRTCPPGRRR